MKFARLSLSLFIFSLLWLTQHGPAFAPSYAVDGYVSESIKVNANVAADQTGFDDNEDDAVVVLANRTLVAPDYRVTATAPVVTSFTYSTRPQPRAPPHIS